jgi:hypothetical protein
MVGREEDETLEMGYDLLCYCSCDNFNLISKAINFNTHQSMVWPGIHAASGVPLLWSSLTMSEAGKA